MNWFVRYPLSLSHSKVSPTSVAAIQNISYQKLLFHMPITASCVTQHPKSGGTNPYCFEHIEYMSHMSMKKTGRIPDHHALTTLKQVSR